MLEAIWLVILGGILGGAFRVVLGFLGEAEPNESFSWVKAIKSLLRAVMGGAILVYILDIPDPKAAFGFAFMSDVASKNVWDIIRERTK